MEIIIGYDFNKNQIINSNKEIQINKDEKIILESIIEELSNNFNKIDFNIIANTTNYLTLRYKNMDIARVKYTDKSKWISILMVNKNLKKQYEDSQLFEAQKNKNQLQWKSSLKDKNINNYISILKISCDDLNNK